MRRIILNGLYGLYYTRAMPRHTQERQVVTVRLDPELRAGLAALFERDGISPSESIRRAVRAWLKTKHIKATAPRRTR